ncbi:hypothetical protein FQN60_002257 [Etheostoma spectabile]|uniref:Uncharacterized protein n=1 Tax=Etheostoma spectabile TaxID=54343 RepID=A0A5J5DC67_9PERO|nr:hypothetical protein FQN60_002257 [Etheostoma spectabile]
MYLSTEMRICSPAAVMKPLTKDSDSLSTQSLCFLKTEGHTSSFDHGVKQKEINKSLPVTAYWTGERKETYTVQPISSMENLVKSICSPPRRCTPDISEKHIHTSNSRPQDCMNTANRMNVEQTKVMRLNTKTHQPIKIKEQSPEDVVEFVYLGRNISTDGEAD